MKTYEDRDPWAGLSVVQREIVTALMDGVPVCEIRRRQRIGYTRINQHIHALAVRYGARSKKPESVAVALFLHQRAA